jgi:5,10-methylenetetrahydrofolate reductase
MDVTMYFEFIRPKLAAPGQDVEILPGSRPITKIGNMVRFLEGQLKITIPSCTLARKIGATVAVQQLDGASNAVISAQMSLSPAVSRRKKEHRDYQV